MTFIPLAFLGVFFLWPLAAMLARGLFGSDITGASGSFDLNTVTSVLGRGRIQRVLWFTCWMSALGTVASTVLGVPLAHLLYRRHFLGIGVLRSLVMLPFVLPTVVVGVAFRSLFAEGGPASGLGIDGTWVPIALAMVFFNVSVVVRTVGPVAASLDPRAGEAAASLGSSPREVFWRVTWPAIRPAVASAGTVVFLFCAGAFGIVLTLGGLRYSTLETEIYTQTVQFLDLRAAAVLSAVQLIFVALIVALGARARRGMFTRGLADHSAAVGPGMQGMQADVADEQVRRGVGVHQQRPPVRFSDWPSVLAALLVYTLILAPLVTLIVRSVRGVDGWTLRHYTALPEVPQALATSWAIAVDATLLALVLGTIASAVLAYRARSRVGRQAIWFLDGLLMLPLGVSAVTVGFGFLITLDRPPLDLRSSSALIPIAQAVVALPLIVRTLLPALRSIDPRTREAALALGANPVRAWFSADFPVIARPFFAATGFALAVSLGEFGATSFLAQPDAPTLPVLIYRLISRAGEDNFGAAMAGSLVLAAITGLVMFVVDRIGGSSAGRM